MNDTLLEALERTRAGYEAECVYHKFQLDAYLSTGGFAGKVKQPAAGFWGRAAEMYSATVSSDNGEIDTYLDRYPSEDVRSFRDRVDGIEYYPYVETLTDLKVSYVLKEDFEARGRPDVVEEWRGDVDGNGTTWGEVFPDIVIRAAVAGWCPVLIDASPTPRGEDGEPLSMTRAQAAELKMQPYPVPLFPANLVDYAIDALGQFTFAKIRVDEQRQEAWDDKPRAVTTYTIWTPDGFSKYEVVQDDKSVTLVDEGPNPFGMVPLVIYRHKAAPGDPVRGMPMHGNVSQLARAHLNRMSEFNEHMRGQVFAQLVLATGDGEAQVQVGIHNALTIDPQSARSHEYIAPPASVAETFEKRLEAIVREMYRLARVEYTRTTGNVMTAEAHAFEFAQTNLALANFAKELAKAEEVLDFVVGRYYGVPDDQLRDSTVIAPDRFDVENLAVDVKTTFDLIAGGLGSTATRLLKMRLVGQALPRLDADTRAAIEQELDDSGKQDSTDAALAAEAEAAAQKLEAEAAAAQAELAAAVAETAA